MILKGKVTSFQNLSPWSCYRQTGKPSPLLEFHRHNDVELSLLRSGRLVYEMQGRRVALESGKLAVFWGAIPHRWIDWSPEIDIGVICMPMPYLLRLKLSRSFVRALLEGKLIREVDESRVALDDALMLQWIRDFGSGQTNLRQIAEIEIEGRLRRLTLTSSSPTPGSTLRGGEDSLSRLLGSICEGASEGLPVAELARRARMHPKYAMRLFNREYGCTLLHYIHQLRISHAQRLLMTTDKRITDVALDSGFGSAAQFHEAFKKITGTTPSALRRMWTNSR